MMRDVYLAGPLERRDQIRALAAELDGRGVRVISTWHATDATRAGEAAASDWRIARELAANESEIRRCDVFVALYPSQGRETLVEMGLALAHRVPVIAVDSIRLASYRRPGVEWIDPAECPDGLIDTLIVAVRDV